MVNARLKWHGKDKHQSIMKNNLNQLGHHVPLSLLQSHPKTWQTDRLRKSKLRLYVIHKNQILISYKKTVFSKGKTGMSLFLVYFLSLPSLIVFNLNPTPGSRSLTDPSERSCRPATGSAPSGHGRRIQPPWRRIPRTTDVGEASHWPQQLGPPFRHRLSF